MKSSFGHPKISPGSVNHYMGVLGKRLEINDHLTTYVRPTLISQPC